MPAMVLPAMMEMASVPGPHTGEMVFRACSIICGLIASRITAGVPNAARSGLTAIPVLARATAASGGKCGIDRADGGGIEAKLQPTFQQGAAHLAGAE